MSSTEERNKERVRQWMDEIWQKRNLGFVEEFIAPDAVIHSTEPEPLHGPATVRQFVEALLNAFPDTRVEVVHLMAEGDWTAVHFRATGTHQGDFMGIAPTGKPIDIRGTSFQRFKEGKMVEEWEIVQEMAMMRQLGVVPAPGA